MARTGLTLLLQEPTRVPQESLECRVAEMESRLRLLTLEKPRSPLGLTTPSLASLLITAWLLPAAT